MCVLNSLSLWILVRDERVVVSCHGHLLTRGPPCTLTTSRPPGRFQLSIMLIPKLAPKSYMYLFFAFFNISRKSSGFIGPIITSAIIERASGTTTSVLV